MKDNTRSIFLGVLLVLAGIIFLLQQLFNVPIGALFIALLFAAGGVAFLYVLLRDRKQWWAVIPGFTLLGLATLIAVSKLFPAFSDRFGGTIFLGSIALSFVLIKILNPDQWWPVIPAGVLATLAVIPALRSSNGMLIPAIFFIGIGATFAILGLLPVGKTEKWPWIPAGICLGIGAIFLVSSGILMNTAFGWIWAAAFIAVGGFLVIRSMVKKE